MDVGDNGQSNLTRWMTVAAERPAKVTSSCYYWRPVAATTALVSVRGGASARRELGVLFRQLPHLQPVQRVLIWINILVERYFCASGQLILRLFESHKEVGDEGVDHHRMQQLLSEPCILQARYVSSSSFLFCISSEKYMTQWA